MAAATVTGKRKSDPQAPPDVLARDQVAAIMEVPNIRTNRGMRLRIILELMYRAGLRISEVLALRPEDIRINGEGAYLRIMRSKRGKSRNVPIGPKLVSYIEGWRAVRPDGDFFICGDKGQELHQQSVWASIKVAVRKATEQHPDLDLDKQEISAHTFRHTYASEMLEDGASLPMLQKALGHSSISTTAIYLHVRDKALADFVQRREEGRG